MDTPLQTADTPSSRVQPRLQDDDAQGDGVRVNESKRNVEGHARGATGSQVTDGEALVDDRRYGRD